MPKRGQPGCPCECGCERVLIAPQTPMMRGLYGDPLPCWATNGHIVPPSNKVLLENIVSILGRDLANKKLFCFHRGTNEIIAVDLASCNEFNHMSYTVLRTPSQWLGHLSYPAPAGATFVYSNFYAADGSRLYGFTKYLLPVPNGLETHTKAWSINHSGGDFRHDHYHVYTSLFGTPVPYQWEETRLPALVDGHVLTIVQKGVVLEDTSGESTSDFYRDGTHLLSNSDFGISTGWRAEAWLHMGTWQVAYFSLSYSSALATRTSSGSGILTFLPSGYSSSSLLSMGYDESNGHLWTEWITHTSTFAFQYWIVIVKEPVRDGNLAGHPATESWIETRDRYPPGPGPSPLPIGSQLFHAGKTYEVASNQFVSTPLVLASSCGQPPTVLPANSPPDCLCLLNAEKLWLRLSGIGGHAGTARIQESMAECGYDLDWILMYVLMNNVYELERIGGDPPTWRWAPHDTFVHGDPCPSLPGLLLESYHYFEPGYGVQYTVGLHSITVRQTCHDGIYTTPSHVITFRFVQRQSTFASGEWSEPRCYEISLNPFATAICEVIGTSMGDTCSGFNESVVKWRSARLPESEPCLGLGYMYTTCGTVGRVAISTNSLGAGGGFSFWMTER